MIRVEINENDIRQSGKNGGVCGEGNSTNMEIVFVSGWDEYVKKVVFYDARGENPVIVLLTDGNRLMDKAEETYLIKIPSEPLKREGKAEFVVDGSIDGARKKSIGGSFEVRYSPDSNVENLPKEVAQTVGEQLQQEAERVATMAQNAAPFIGDNGNWYVYDIESRTHIDTGIQSYGKQGEQGPEGKQGEKGEPGYTPQRGTDYWTDNDKAEIKGDVAAESKPFVIETQLAEDGGANWTVDKTYEETYEAYVQKKEILLRHFSSTFRLVVHDSYTFVFSCVRKFSDNSWDVTIAIFKKQGNVVSFEYLPVENIDNKVAQITDEATYIQYPTVQAVVDYINGKGFVDKTTEQTIYAKKTFMSPITTYDSIEVGQDIEFINDPINKVTMGMHNGFLRVNSTTDRMLINDKRILTDTDKTEINNGLSQISTDLSLVALQLQQRVSPLDSESLVVNTVYIGSVETGVTLDLPGGTFGDFIQVDFVSGETPTTLVVKSSNGTSFSDINLVPEPNTVYSLYFDYGVCGYGSPDGIADAMALYGWKFAYAEYASSGV